MRGSRPYYQGTQNFHWQHFLTLCEDFEKTVRFVEPTEDNLKTYSDEFVRLLLAAGSEVDVVCKALCKQINSAANPKSIVAYRSLILSKYHDMVTVKVVVPRTTLSLTPWSQWQKEKSPDWWKNYNLVKHQRPEHSKSGNVENALNAVAGLLVLVGYLYAEDLLNCSLAPSGNFIQFDKQYHAGFTIRDHGNVAGYLLPGVPNSKKIASE